MKTQATPESAEHSRESLGATRRDVSPAALTLLHGLHFELLARLGAGGDRIVDSTRNRLIARCELVSAVPSRKDGKDDENDQ